MEGVDDAIILAGGNGTRMLPASLYMPKETMPLVDTPILNHLIWEAARAGVKRIHLVLSQRKKEILDRFIGNEDVFDRGVLRRAHDIRSVGRCEVNKRHSCTRGDLRSLTCAFAAM